MMRVLMALLLAATGTAASRPQDQKVERAPSRIVIDVSVMDGQGNPVTDLRREEIEIWISGYRAPIESFVQVAPEDEQLRRSLVLLLDDLTLPLPLVPRAREIARRFVDGMVPGDELALVTLNGSVVEPTSDRAKLRAAVERFNVRTIGVVPFDSLGERVLERVDAIARQLAATNDRRKTIVGIGSAWLLDTPIPPPTVGRDLRVEWTNAMRSLAFANAVFFVIDPAGVGVRAFGGDSGFARETGGLAFVNTNDYDGAVTRVLREASSYYLVGVTDPPIRRKADLRELEVRVLRNGISVRARRVIGGSE